MRGAEHARCRPGMSSHTLTERRLTRHARPLPLGLLAFTWVTACFPVLPLSPAVQPGVRSGGAASVHGLNVRVSSLDDSTRTKWEGMPQVTAYTAVGVRGAAHLPAARVTLFLTSGLGLGADAFLQAPKQWTGAWDAGGGVLVQGGMQDANGWHLSVGREMPAVGYMWVTGGPISVEARRDGQRHRVVHVMAGAHPRVWRPELRAFVGAVVGPQDERCGKDPRAGALAVCPSVTRFYLGVGAEAWARAFRRPMRR